MKKSLSIILLISFLAACSSVYIIPDGASSNQVFQEACSSCHKAKGGAENYFIIKAQNRNIRAISSKISHGGLLMPAFPNISKRPLQELSQFVLSHSVEK